MNVCRPSISRLFCHITSWTMLSSRDRLHARQGQYTAPRHEYLQQLVDEFQRSPDTLRKEEVVANLANFAYDPINYTSLCTLRIMDLFLDILDTASQDPSNVNKTTYDDKTAKQKRPSSSSPQLVRQHQLVEFALGGICNCIPDFSLRQQFIEGDGVEILVSFILELPLEGDRSTALTPSELNVIVSSLSIAFFLLDSSAFTAITSDQLIAKMRQCQQNSIVQVSNTAAAFLTRYQELLAV